MPIREFKDSNGIEWRVWSTRPSNPSFVVEPLRAGWLTFDSDGERRRLSPVPPGWEVCSLERLELACRVAIRTRVSPGHGVNRRTLLDD